MRIILTFLIPLLTACNSGKPFVSPSSSEVSAMTAELFRRPDTGRNIARFEVPKASYKAMLASLNGAHHDNFGKKWMVLGDIDITLTTGSVHVRLYWTGRESGAFKVNGTYYRGASDFEFLRLIEAAKKQSEQGGGGNALEPPSHPSTSTPTSRATP